MPRIMATMSQGQRPKRRGRREAFAAAGIALALGGTVGAAFLRPTAPCRIRKVAFLVDASISTTDANRCPDVARMARRELARGDDSLQLSLFSTGDRTTGSEPVRVGLVTWRRSGRLAEGAGQDDEDRNRFLSALDKLCRGIPARRESPIFRSVDAVIRGFSVEECQKAGTSCALLVRSDGIEEEDARLVQALRRRKADKAAATPRIDNAARHVEVAWCGLSERVVRKGAGRLPTVGEVEAAFGREFSAPVRFETACAPFEAAK